MNDPHVASLRYRLVTDTRVNFIGEPAPVEHQESDFEVRLADGIAVFRPLKHFSSAEAARAEIDRYVKAWEIRAALELDVPADALKFEFEDAEVIDRDPLPATYRLVALSGVYAMTAVGNITLTKGVKNYPSPPTEFLASPDVETLWFRWAGYQKQREPLQGMAYFCLTLVETRFGGRKEAARQLRIEDDVLGRVGELTSERGDFKTARKVTSKTARLLTLEKYWLEAAVKKLIWRLGEVEARSGEASSLPRLGMSDLPPL